MPFRSVFSLLLSSLTFVNEGSSLTVVNEELSFTIVNETTNFLKTIVFKKIKGYPTKYESSETTLRNLYCFVFYIYDSQQLISFLVKSLKKVLKGYI